MKKPSAATAEAVVLLATSRTAVAAPKPVKSVATQPVSAVAALFANVNASCVPIVLLNPYVPNAMTNNLILTKTIPKQTRRPRPPMLRFTPTAWAKLLFLRDAGNTEVGGFGIAATDDLLLVTDFQLIEQTCSAISVAFDDTAVAEFFDQQVDLGLHPSRFARIWIHTHPGDSPNPSTTDEETFQRVFGHCDWAVMFILARGGQTYCRLQYHSGPPIAVELDVEVDYGQPFAASDQAAWLAEHQAKVVELVWEPKQPTAFEKTNGRDVWDFHRERDDGPTTLAHQNWIDERQRQWEEDVAWEEYLQTQEESEYAFHYD